MNYKKNYQKATSTNWHHQHYQQLTYKQPFLHLHKFFEILQT